MSTPPTRPSAAPLFLVALLGLVAGCGSSEEPSPAPHSAAPNPQQAAAPRSAPPGTTRLAEDAEPVRSVLILTVDTLRADALGCYGNADAATPAIDRLAAESVVFERAYSQATITHPALSSMLTGLLPVHHGVHNQAARLQEGAYSTALVAQAAGYRTASFVANLCKLQEQPQTVFHDGWEHMFCGMDTETEQHQWDADVVDAALEWLEDNDEPFFVWVHLMDPHAEHRPAPELWDYEARPVRSKSEQYEHFGAYEQAREMLSEEDATLLADLYAAEVAGVDRQVARLVAALDAAPQGDEVAIVFGSDHGEELFETWSRYDHGLSMTEGVLWVPLFVRAPGLAPARVAEPVELLSVAPTVHELLGLAAPRAFDGPSLLSAERRDFALSFAGSISVSLRTAAKRYWLRRTDEPYVRAEDEFPWRADAPWFQHKECFAEYPPEAPTRVEWLELSDDAHTREAARLRAELERYAKTLNAADTARIEDPELEAQLRELGYTEGEL